MTLIACRVPIIEPFRIHFAPGWFFMGSDVGQTVESPVHRVCLDSFAMAATSCMRWRRCVMDTSLGVQHSIQMPERHNLPR
jgi:hypothetical protein